MMGRTAATLAAIVLGLGAVGGAEAQRLVRIGCYTALTGPNLQVGVASRDGLRMAISDAQSRFPIFRDAIRLDLRCEDSQGRPDEAVAVSRRLVADSEVIAVIGAFTSFEAMAAAPVYDEAKTPFYAPVAINPDVTKQGPWVRRINVDPDKSHEGPADYAFKLGKRKIVFLTYANDSGRIGSANFKRDFERHGDGATLVRTDFVRVDQTDFRTVLTDIRAQAPDAVHAFLLPNQVSSLLRQARQTGFDIDITLDYVAWSRDTIRLAGEVANGRPLVYPVAADRFAELGRWQERFEKEFGVAPDIFALNFYTAGSLILDSIAALGAGATRDALREAVEGTRSFESIAGRISYDPGRREWTYPVSFGLVENGKFVLHPTLNR